jgi:hypothetical protein
MMKTSPKVLNDPVITERPSRFLGLVTRKSCWTLSLRGWVVLFLIGMAALSAIVFGIHPFLAVTRTVDAEYLVIEGWIQPYAIKEGVAEFHAHSYRKIFTTGGPVPSLREVSDEEGYTYAHLAAGRLKQQKFPKELIEIAPAEEADRDRTFTSAVALRRKLEEKAIAVKALNVVTVGAHARRTRLLYEKAFGNDVKIGVISVRNREYNAEHWWKYSEGIREVFSEGVAYLYVRFLF